MSIHVGGVSTYPCFILYTYGDSDVISMPAGFRRHLVMLYPQNGDRIVATDSVTSLNPMYILSKRDQTNEPVHLSVLST